MEVAKAGGGRVMKCIKTDGSNGCTVCVYNQATDLYAVNEWILWYLNDYFKIIIVIVRTLQLQQQKM